MKRQLLATAVVLALIFGPNNVAWAHGPGGQGGGSGPGGPEMMMNNPGTMMGAGMMAPMLMRGPGAMHAATVLQDRDLTADDVRELFERNLSWHRNTRLKVGDVTEMDDDTITVDIVTIDSSLVQRLEVDRHTGFKRQLN